MTLLFVGHESDCYEPGNSSNVESTSFRESTTLGRAGVRVDGAPVVTYPDWGAVDELWVRFGMGGTNAGGTSGSSVIWDARNAAGTVMARIRKTAGGSNGAAVAEVWNGATYTAVSGAIVVYNSDGTAKSLRVHFKGGVSGVFQIWYEGALILDVTGDYSSAVSMVRCGFRGGVTSTSCVLSHVVIATTSILNMQCEQKPPAADSTDAATATATGTFADIDETSMLATDFVQLTNAGDRRSFTYTARTLTLEKVEGVTLSCNALYEPGGATSIRPYLKIGGVRYYGTTFALGLTSRGYQYTWTTNPATGVAFTTAEANAAGLEGGWEAV